jgi:hypothetical protein
LERGDRFAGEESMPFTRSVVDTRGDSKTLFVGALLLLLCIMASPVRAHHGGHQLSEPSPACGWIDGQSLRDRRNLTDFCARWMPAELRISGASANRDSLWIETPPDLVSLLRADDRTTTALLREWLEHWRKTTGYNTASVVLLRNHVEFARIQTTMAGDVITKR